MTGRRDGGGLPHSLVLCAHGTASPAGQQVVLDLVTACAVALAGEPDTEVLAAYVDVQQPEVADVVADAVARGREVSVVPLLMCAGYHVQVDIARAVAPHQRAAARGPLGPSPLLAELLVTRLREAGAPPDAAVVLAAAGSSRASAAADARAQRELVQKRWSGPVSVAYGSAAQPSVPQAVAAARADGARQVAVAAYLLGAGHFHDRLAEAGADLVTAPMGADPLVVQRVLERFREPPAAPPPDLP
ncbi:sirohydrochlorin chelatase [Actinomycetota bacterium]